MKRKTTVIGCRGVTLVELLVSITLLSIVLITFFGFFSQTMMFSVKVEDQLTALNVAEDVLVEMKDDRTSNIEEKRVLNNTTYYPDVHILSQTAEERALNLARAHVKVYIEKDSNDSPEAELYTYIDCEERPCEND